MSTIRKVRFADGTIGRTYADGRETVEADGEEMVVRRRAERPARTRFRDPRPEVVTRAPREPTEPGGGRT